jgi:hypothetical protein
MSTSSGALDADVAGVVVVVGAVVGVAGDVGVP